jgi:hypothetical protein
VGGWEEGEEEKEEGPSLLSEGERRQRRLMARTKVREGGREGGREGRESE